MKQFEHVKIIDSELHREYFTKHGMHMKKAGKEVMAQRIVEHIREIFSRGKHLPLPCNGSKILSRGLHCHEKMIETSMDGTVDNMQENLSLLMGNDKENSNYNSDNSKDLLILDSVTGCSENKGILPKRERKCLKAKNEDFLWF
jgi:hypothetical protein